MLNFSCLNISLFNCCLLEEVVISKIHDEECYVYLDCSVGKQFRHFRYVNIERLVKDRSYS